MVLAGSVNPNCPKDLYTVMQLHKMFMEFYLVYVSLTRRVAQPLEVCVREQGFYVNTCLLYLKKYVCGRGTFQGLLAFTF